MWAAFFTYAAVVAAIFTFGVRFRHHQNKNTAAGTWVGGEISWPKSLWLAWAIGAWFLLPFALLLQFDLPPEFRYLFIVHLTSWWVRGVLELVMIYRWFNWTPVYGISHDALHNMVLIVGLVAVVGRLGLDISLRHPAAYIALGYFVLVIFSLMAEMVFAALFISTRGVDKHKIYFASDDPIYKLINQMTAAVVWIVYTGTFVLGALLLHRAWELRGGA